MARLIDALGEDGLDDVALQSLNAFYEDEGDESEDDQSEGVEGVPKVIARANADSNESEGSDEDESGDEQDADQDEGAVALDDVSSVDEDAVSHQKITVDNKV